MRGLCGAAWVPTELQLAHRRPVDVRPYKRFFRAPLRFDATHNALLFPAKWLSQPLPQANADLRRHLQDEAARINAHHGIAFVDKVRRAARAALVTRSCSADAVATSFAMQRRTLSRRLKAEGTTYEALLDQVRYEVARQLLSQTNTSIGTIADTLGYADASPFIRAFRRWSGTTPAQWRAHNATADT
jgi:AraC-like DNA-binding protein